MFCNKISTNKNLLLKLLPDLIDNDIRLCKNNYNKSSDVT